LCARRNLRHARPTNIGWQDVRTPFEAPGANVRARDGSPVRATLNGMHTTLHAPHPSPVIGVKTIADVRKFLLRAGVMPEE
jgi:hypothetical protein